MNAGNLAQNEQFMFFRNQETFKTENFTQFTDNTRYENKNQQ